MACVKIVRVTFTAIYNWVTFYCTKTIFLRLLLQRAQAKLLKSNSHYFILLKKIIYNTACDGNINLKINLMVESSRLFNKTLFKIYLPSYHANFVESKVKEFTLEKYNQFTLFVLFSFHSCFCQTMAATSE